MLFKRRGSALPRTADPVSNLPDQGYQQKTGTGKMEEAGPSTIPSMYQMGDSLIVRTAPRLEKGRSPGCSYAI